MKRRLFATLALVMALGSLTPPGTVQASIVSRFSYSDRTAEAAFSSVDASNCIVTQVFLFATKSRSSTSSGSKVLLSEANISIFKFDQCAEPESNPVLLDANGGPISLSKLDFRIGDGLSWARLNKTINVYDFVSAGAFDVTVAMYWIGSGSLTAKNNRSIFTSARCTTVTQDQGATRLSTAWGSVSDGITNYTPEPAVSTELASVKSGELTRSCI